jgi:hypothetical protein
MPFPEQVRAANNILSVFSAATFRYAMLIAVCQAGKTGAFQELIRLMLDTGVVNSVYILCGSNETELRIQARADTEKANGAAYAAGAIKVLFRQDFKGSKMDITNSLIVVDESHMDQAQQQELYRFLGQHGLTMDGNPKTLNEKNTYILSVDATPYSELAALQHKESFPKHVEVLEPGVGYFGLSDYFYGDLIKPTFDIVTTPLRFLSLVKDNKYGIMRLQNGKKASQQEAAAINIYKRKGGNIYYYTADKTDIAITAAQKALLKVKVCLEDMPKVPSLVIIRGRLRAGKVVPKEHIGFVWEGAKTSKTDSLVQGLAGRMCGYDFGEDKPIIFLPPSSLKRHDDKVIKASEIERALMGFPVVLPQLGMNLKKGHLANAAANGKTQCSPLRLTWDAADEDEWTPETANDGLVTGERCRELLIKNSHLITAAPFSNYQKEEITAFIATATPYTRTLSNDKSETFKKYFGAVIEACSAKTAVAEHVTEFPQMTFFITKDACVPHANKRHIYVIFYTDSTGGPAGLMNVDLKSRIPVTNQKSVFSTHASQFDTPIAAGGVVGIDEAKIKSPQLLEGALRTYLRLYKDSAVSGLVVARCIQSVDERFKLSKATFAWASPKSNSVEVVCASLSREFSVKLKVSYVRGGGDHFNVKKIEW